MKFLQQIAKIYAEKLTPTAQLLFVFPNRRAGLFFKKELLALTKNATFAPEITDINSFVANLSPLKKTNDIELLFMLYDSYVQVRSKNTQEIETIDAFIPFGTTLLGDFNEIDKYLVDTNLLFSNISDLKNINDQSQFLSEQQLEALKSFWNNVNVKDENTENLSFKKQFISLWDDLYDIYTHFTQQLIEKNIAYDGLIYRNFIESLELQNRENSVYPFKNICFIGFNSLTTSEYRIFKHFQKMGIADFYFDYPTFYASPSPLANSVAKYYERNLKEFPSKYNYTQPTEKRIPNITIHSTPSITNQVNIACSLLTSNPIFENPSSTAILLSDESLMPSLTQQLPNSIKTINITMGYPLSITPIATLINHILTLQTELTYNKENTPQFYYKPLLSILSHQKIQTICPTSSSELIKQITQGNYIRIEVGKLHTIISELKIENEEKNFFKTLFTTYTDTLDLIEYLNNIISLLSTFKTQHTNPTDQEFLYQYQQSLRQLTTILNKSQITLPNTQLLRVIINRLTSSLKVQFRGEPVEGMQIMGLLESRLLDFENIILLGFNDQKIPGNKSVNSIIPYNLRHIYNLPTQEESNAIQAYNFYRTLYHTQNIHLIYDSRSEGAQNEISRYFYQMKYLLGAPMNQYNYTLPINNNLQSDITEKNNNSSPITIEKSEEIIQKLDRYKLTHFLSASKIKDYITCPLRFYFTTIVNIKTPNEITEIGEVSLLGRIYHRAMEEYYIKHSIPKKISKKEIEKLVEDAFSKESEESSKQINITGFNSLTFNMVCQYIEETLSFDNQRYTNQQFKDVKSEVEIKTKIQDINFVAYIDRIDKTNSSTNIIDYKTTIGKTNANINIIELFTSPQSAYHELFQIIFYCYIYKLTSCDTSILPTLYKMYSLKSQNGKLTTITLDIPNQLLDKNNLPSYNTNLNEIDTDKNNCTKIEITNYDQISVPFEWLMHKTLNDIFNPNIPFTSNPLDIKQDGCKYCHYKTLCRRTDKKD